jgi:hypothetical protein
MGTPDSPLAQAVVNFCMEQYDQKTLVAASVKLVHWYRHADDTFVDWHHNKDELGKFRSNSTASTLS